MPVHAASLADLADLVPLFSAYLDFYEVPAPEEQVRAFLAERLRQGDSTLFLARDAEARALGFVQLYPLFASLALRPSWLLSDLYVRPEARRQGVGEALMNQARGFRRKHGRLRPATGDGEDQPRRAVALRAPRLCP